MPGRRVTTAELVEQVHPKRDAAEVEARTGIRSRYFAEPGTTCAELAAQALAAALADAEIAPERLERIIFVNSTGGDMLIPATANTVAASLGLGGTCDCFDLNNACMGFLTAFDIGARGVAMGSGPVGIVAVELASRYHTPAVPRPFLVFGDGAGAAILDTGHPEEGVLASWLRNDGSIAGTVTFAHPGLTNRRETAHFNTSNREMGQLALEIVRRSTDAVLSQSGLQLSEVDWILPHQPNGFLLQAMIADLGIDPDRVVPVVQDVGSMASASIPISLDRLRRSRSIRPGHRILMVGVGAGLCSGAILHQIAP